MIYLDNNATTALDPAVREAMLPYLGQRYGNPSSAHRFGQEARHAIEEARQEVAALMGCSTRELIFTSGGTEADNAAIQGLLAARAPRKVVVTSTVEHSAVREVLAVWRKLEEGATVIEIPVDVDGRLDMEKLTEVLRQRGQEIALLTFMWANNETGVIFDVGKIGELCRAQGVPLHVDGVQAVGKIAMKVQEMAIDLMSLSAHKIHGPKGVGGLFVRRGVRWQPWLRGGPQEQDRRGGTENVPGIVGMGVAAGLARKALADDQVQRRIETLRDELQRGILARIKDAQVVGGRDGGQGEGVVNRVTNTTNIGFAGLEAEAILLLLSERDICASAGAACSSGSLEPSHVLRAMGVAERVAHGAIRLSLSRFTTAEDVGGVLEVLPGIIARLRETLPM